MAGGKPSACCTLVREPLVWGIIGKKNQNSHWRNTTNMEVKHKNNIRDGDMKSETQKN